MDEGEKMVEEQTTLAQEATPEELSKMGRMERPDFKKPTPARIREAKLMTFSKVETDAEGGMTQRGYIQVACDLEKPHKLSDGTEIMEAVTNYGVTIYINGKPPNQHKVLYWGKSSDAAKLLELLCSVTNLTRNSPVGDILKAMGGRKVMLKTELRQNPKDKQMVPKAMVVQILPE